MWSQIWTALKGELRLNIDAYTKRVSKDSAGMDDYH